MKISNLLNAHHSVTEKGPSGRQRSAAVQSRKEAANIKAREISHSPQKVQTSYTTSPLKFQYIRTCDNHSDGICGNNFEFADPSQYYKRYTRPINATAIDNYEFEFHNVPTPRNASHVTVTDDALYDWLAQSMNRNPISIVSGPKNFAVPPTMMEGLKKKYESVDEKTKNRAKVTAFYFSPKEPSSPKKQKGEHSISVGARRPPKEAVEYIFDSSLLEPHFNPNKTTSSELNKNPAANRNFRLSKLAAGIRPRTKSFSKEHGGPSLNQLPSELRGKSREASAEPEAKRPGLRQMEEMLGKKTQELVQHHRLEHLAKEDIPVDRDRIVNNEDEMLDKLGKILELDGEQTINAQNLPNIQNFNRTKGSIIDRSPKKSSVVHSRGSSVNSQKIQTNMNEMSIIKARTKAIWAGRQIYQSDDDGSFSESGTTSPAKHNQSRLSSMSPNSSDDAKRKKSPPRSYKPSRFKPTEAKRPFHRLRGLCEADANKYHHRGSTYAADQSENTSFSFNDGLKKQLVSNFYDNSAKYLATRDDKNDDDDDHQDQELADQYKTEANTHKDENPETPSPLENGLEMILGDEEPSPILPIIINSSHPEAIDEIDNAMKSYELNLIDLRSVEGGSESMKSGSVRGRSSNKYSGTKEDFRSVEGGSERMKPGSIRETSSDKYAGTKKSSISNSVYNSPMQEYNNAEFWFARGALQMKENNFRNAIDCFKQVLLLNPQYYICIFNIGCMYEQLEEYESSRKWLQLCYTHKFSLKEVLFALALCEFKTNDYTKCFEYLVELEKILHEENNSDEPEYKFTYLMALCCKELGKRDRAKKMYLILQSQIIENTKLELTKSIMKQAFLNLRKLPSTLSKEDVSAMQTQLLLLNPQPIKTSILSHLYVPNDGWRSDFVREVLITLKTKAFWRRFPIEFLQTLLKLLSVEVVPAGSIIFMRSSSTMVILQGTAVIRDHSVDPLNPKTLAYLSEGSIIGHDETDDYIFRGSEVWVYALTDIEVIKVKKREFEKIWMLQKDYEKANLSKFLGELEIFKGVCSQTLYRLGFELMKRDTFSKDEIVFNDNSYLKSRDVKDIQSDFQDSLNQRFGGEATTEAIKQSKRAFAKLDEGRKRAEQKINSHCLGFYVVLSGECAVENWEGTICTTLGRGAFFGESLMFSTLGLNNFGRIRVTTDKVEVLFLPIDDFKLIPFYEMDFMRKNCRNRAIIKRMQHSHDNKIKK